ncbi:MAG: AbgT family transporter [Lachnospiraceae bacterium]|nr:AbgT family transporter [Lachnospiraceae bacterium]MCI9592348.1 AbgT family transporter [Lachnospiraceae bacterium]
MKGNTETKKRSWFLKFLDGIETAGNKLPTPLTIFFYLAVLVVIISGIGAAMGWSATGEMYNSSSGAVEETTIKVVSLFSISGLQYMLTSAVSNFTGYAPLGFTIVIMLGIGVAESSGYLNGLIKKVVKITPAMLVTPMVVFIGVMTNVAENAGYVVFIPLAAMIFKAYNKHPLAGIAAGFAGVSGGFSANLLIGSADATLSGFSTAAAQTIDPNYTVTPLSNWFFMIASTILITIVGTLITELVVIPRLGPYKENGDGTLVEPTGEMTQKEEKALSISNWVFVAIVVFFVACCIPQNSFMRNAETGSLINNSTLMNAIIPLFTLLFFIPSFVYGKLCGTFKTDKDVVASFNKAIASVSGFVAMAFVAAQFTSYFGKTNIGRILSFKGAELLQSLNVNSVGLMMCFILVAGFVNLFMASASAKYAIFAPVFVPMFMKLGLSPELTQVAYRIGDSTTNIIAPVIAWIPYILTIMKKYDKDTGWGTLVSSMLPYSLAFIISWSVMLALWMVLNLPLGPGAPVFYTMG